MINDKSDRPWRRRVRIILPTVAALMVGSVVTVLASHQFNDVPDSHAFHDEISAIADAGITTGFPDGGFHPSSAVTRQAMAAFMERGLGKAASDFDVAPLGTNSGVFETAVAIVEVGAGATGGGGGFVSLQGSWTAYADDLSNVAAQCPCELEGGIADEGGVVAASWEDLDGTFTDTGFTNASGSVSLVLPIAADTTETYVLYAALNDADVDEVTFEGTLTAIYVPFGSPEAVMSSSDDDQRRR